MAETYYVKPENSPVNDMTLNAGDAMFITNGGTANGTIINSDGAATVNDGGSANNTTVNEGGTLHALGGTATGVNVEKGGRLEVNKGATATGITAAKGATLVFDVAADTHIAGTSDGAAFQIQNGIATGFVLETGVLIVSDGGKAVETVLNSAGFINVSQGGSADKAVINTSGELKVSSGGTATEATVKTGGKLTVESSGFCDDATIEMGGNLYVVSSGGTAAGTYIGAMGNLAVSKGGTAYGTTVGAGGFLTVGTKGIAEGADVNGFLNVLEGGLASNVTVNEGAVVYIQTKGTGSDVSVENGGSLEVLAGGRLKGATVSQGGSATIHADVMATKVVVDGGKVTVMSDGWAYQEGDSSNTIVQNGGRLVVSGGGFVVGAAVSAGGHVTVESDATFSSATVVAADVTALDGAYVSRLNLEAGGILNVVSGGKAEHINVSAGGVLTGILREASELKFYGGTLDLNIAGVSPESEALVDNISFTAIMPVAEDYLCTLTVSDTQAEGAYTLIEDATVFDKTITVKDTSGTTLGTLTVAEGTKTIGETKYTLAITRRHDELADEDFDDLTVTIGEPGGNIISGDIADDTKDVPAGWSAVNVNVNANGSLNVLDGGKASSTTVNDGGKMYVSSGGVASSTTVNINGYLFLMKGGVASDTTVNKGGQISVASTGVASNTTVSSGGSIGVAKGGSATNITAIDGANLSFNIATGMYAQGTLNGSAFEFKDAAVSDYTIRKGMTLNPMSGGSTSDVTVDSGGSMILWAGGVAKGTVVEVDGLLRLRSAGGIASDVRIEAGGRLEMMEGKLTGQMMFDDYAKVTVSKSDAIVDFDISALSPSNVVRLNNLSVISGTPTFTLTVGASQAEGTYNLAANASSFASDQTIMVVDTLGTELSTLTVAGGTKTIDGVKYTLALTDDVLTVTLGDGGGITPDITGDLNSDFELTAGMVGSSVNILDGGNLKVTNGGFTSQTTVNSGGTLFISEGGIASDTTLNDNGKFRVLGTASKTAIAAGGSMYVHGSADSATVAAGGRLVISSGGKISNITAELDGAMDIESGASATGIVAAKGARMTLRIAPNTYVQGTYDGNAFELKDAVLSGFTLKTSGVVNVLDGGVTSDVTVSGGLIRVYNGSVAKDTLVSAGGELMLREEGAVANGVTIKNGGKLTFSEAGGKLTGKVTIETGAIISVCDGAIVDFDLTKTTTADPALVNNLSFFGTAAVNYTLTVDGTEADGDYKLAENATGFDKTITVVNTSGVTLGTLTVGEVEKVIGGQKYTLTLNGTGSLGVTLGDGGGTTPDITGDLDSTAHLTEGMYGSSVNILDGGNLEVFEGGFTSQTTVNSGGDLSVSAGGSANVVTVNFGGDLFVRNGGIATLVKENGGYASVNDGATVTFVSNSFGGYNYNKADDWCTIHSGTTGTDLTVGNDGKITVYDGGVASQTTVNSNGDLAVSEGGVADVVTVNFGGDLYVLNGGVATLVKENGGYVGVDDGATATFVSNSFGGYVYNNADDWCTIHDGTTGSNLTAANKGRIYVYSGGIASDTTVNDKGIVEGNSGGLIDGVVVNSGGSLLIYNGAKLTGQMTFVTGAEVIPFVGSILDFDLTQTAPDAAALVNDLSILMGTPTYTLTVDASQAEGTYSLAGGAAGFDKTITVVNTSGTELGTLTVAEGTKTIGETKYTLSLTGSNLSVTVGDTSVIDNTPPTITITPSTTESATSVTLTAVFDDDVAVATKEYMIDSEGVWKSYTGPVTVTENVYVSFRATDTSENGTVQGYNVTNIETSTPVNGPAEPKNNTLYLDKTHVNMDVTEAAGTTLTAAGQEILFDQTGAVDVSGYHNSVDKDDGIDYAKIVLKNGAKLSFHAEATAAATFTVYSLTEKNSKYTLKKLQTLKLTDKDKDGVFTADSSKLLSLSVSGAYYVSMQFTDKDKSKTAYYNVTLNGEDSKTPSEFYPLGNNTDDWTNMKTVGYGSGAEIDDLGEIKDGTLYPISGEWAGFGDKVDCKKFTLNSAAELSLSVSAQDGPLKLSVCRLKATTSKKTGKTTYSQVTIKSVTVKAGQPKPLDSLRLAAGDYFFKAESTNEKKSTGYSVQITDGEFYTDGDDGWNNVLLDGKKLNENAEHFYNNTLSTAGSIYLDKAGNDMNSSVAAEYGEEKYGGFVGFGDETDFAKLSLTETSDVKFTLEATNDATLEIFKVTEKDGKYSKKSVQTVKYKSGGEAVSSKKPVTLEVKDGVSYYVSVKATNIKKTTADPRTYYNVSYAVVPKDASSLSMPETDALASSLSMPDTLSLGQYDTDVLAGTSFDSASDKLLAESGAGLLASL